MADMTTPPLLSHTAMILAAGYGKRLRPLTEATPKPMLEIAGRSILYRLLDTLLDHGIQRIAINTGYLADQLAAHVDAYPFPSACEIHLSREAEPLETAGGILQALPWITQKDASPFLVLNGDTLWAESPDGTGKTTALQALQHAWKAEKAQHDERKQGILLLAPRDTFQGYEGAGDFDYENETHLLTHRGKRPAAPYVFTGVQLLHPRLFAPYAHRKGDAFSMREMYFAPEYLTPDHTLMHLAGCVHTAEWLHVGTLDGYHAAQRFFAAPEKNGMKLKQYA